MTTVIEMLDAQLAKLDAERERIIKARALMADHGGGNGHTATAYKPAVAPPDEVQHRRVKASPESIVRIVSEFGGEPVAAGQIRERLMPISPNALSVRLGEMVKKGKLVRHGERRFSKYTVPQWPA